MICAFGERRGVNITVLHSEWHDALRFYDPAIIEVAWKKVRGTSKYWPTIAEFMDFIRAEMPLPDRHRPIEPDEPICREGRTLIEETAHRAAQCLRWRAQYPSVFKPEVAPSRPPKPPSQGDLSPEFIAHAKRQGIYHPSPETTNEELTQ